MFCKAFSVSGFTPKLKSKKVLSQVCFMLNRNPQCKFCGLRRQKCFYELEIILFELAIASAIHRSQKLKKAVLY